MLAVAALAVLGMALAPQGAYALPVCGTTISDCCRITSPGSYSVTGDFSASGPYGACIRIAAQNVILNGHSHTITGPGATSSMKGIVVAAQKAFVGGLIVSDFKVGLQSNARKTTVGLFGADSNGIGIILKRPTAELLVVAADNSMRNGLVIDGAGISGTAVSGLGNGLNGIVINSTAAGTKLQSVYANGNGKTGIRLNGTTGGFLQNLQADNNGKYGIWLRGTTGVPLFDFQAGGNSIAGVYLGCHANGPSSAPCGPSVSQTRGSLVEALDSSSSANGPGQQYGVAIDIRNGANRVAGVTANSNTVEDGYDGKPGCGSNSWSLNSFTATNQSCVQ